MAINPSLGDCCRISPHKARIAERQIQCKEMRLLLHPTDYNHGFAEIRLGVAGGMCQWHKHLPTAPPMFTDIGLDRRVAAAKLVLVAQPFKDALGGVALFAGTVQIVLQPLINEAGEAIKFGPPDLRRPLIAGWHREHHHLLHARTRYPEMAGGLPFAHPAPTREADLPIKFYAENTPALPANSKGQSGNILRCPQQDYPATSVAHFCTAVLSPSRAPQPTIINVILLPILLHISIWR